MWTQARCLRQAVDTDGILYVAHTVGDVFKITAAGRISIYGTGSAGRKGERLRGPTDVAFAGPDRDVLLAASLDNLVIHRFGNVGARGLPLNHPRW